MLAIHRGDEFAAVKFWRGQKRRGQFRGEQHSRFFAKPPGFNRQNRAAKHVVDFDLHLIAPPPDEQFDFVAILGG